MDAKKLQRDNSFPMASFTGGVTLSSVTLTICCVFRPHSYLCRLPTLTLCWWCSPPLESSPSGSEGESFRKLLGVDLRAAGGRVL